MKAKILTSLTLAIGLLPLAVVAQDQNLSNDDVDGMLVEEIETVPTQQAQETLADVQEENAPDEADFGLDTASEAVTEGGVGVDGQATSDTASEGRSTEARGNAGGLNSTAAGGARGNAGGRGNADAAGSGGGSGGGSGAGGSGSGGGPGGNGGGPGGNGGGPGGNGGGPGGNGGGPGGNGGGPRGNGGGPGGNGGGPGGNGGGPGGNGGGPGGNGGGPGGRS